MTRRHRSIFVDGTVHPSGERSVDLFLGLGRVRPGKIVPVDIPFI
jgi:hypothetical protein